jgi:hypothetical protein
MPGVSRKPLTFSPLLRIGSEPKDLHYVLTEYRANLRESAVNATGETRHSCRGSESDQRDDQNILDQTLTRFLLVEADH